MKKLLMSILVILGVLCLGSAALAEGFTVYGDYSIMDTEFFGESFDADTLTLGGEFAMEPFIVGGFYSTMMSFDPEPPPYIDVSADMYLIYGGYAFLNDDAYSLAGILAYLGISFDIDDSDWPSMETDDFTGFLAGFKGAMNFDPFSVSLIYLFGVSGTWDYYYSDPYGPPEEGSFDIDLSYLELKATYQFSEAWGAYLVYRSVQGDFSGIALIETSGFGLGVQFSF